jgi:hypothetical protein
MTESELKVIDTTFHSEGFPDEKWDQLITRTNYISQIEDGILNGIHLFFIKGEEDSGKTTLAAQIVRKHINSTISVFFNPSNTLDYEIDYFCRNVVLQIGVLLKDASNEDNAQLISTEQYKQSLYHLRKFIKRNRTKINLVIDGLEDRVTEMPEFIRTLFSIMPFGENYFNIIISGGREDFISTYSKLKREESKEISVMGFSDTETLKYLNVTETTPNSIRDLYKVTKGYPGRLKTLRRLMTFEGYTLEKISKTTTYNSWLEIDCQSVDLNSSKNNVILSLLSFTENSFSRDEIAKICSLDTKEVENIVDELPILEATDKYVIITSNAHKRYLANILRANKSKVNELLIRFYAENESINSLRDLPRLYSEKKEWAKVIQLLDDQYLHRILEKTGSLKVVNETLELGVSACEKSNRYSDLLRYSIQGSIVNELDNYLFWESEIEARISIQDFVGAISLAESAVVLVDRLRLLALIARRQKEFNNNVDEVLTNLIQELYNTIDLTSVGEKIYDIVAHLIYALPNLAIEMIEKSASGVVNDNINDWVVAKLSIAAIDSSLRSEQKLDSSKKLEALQALNNPSVKKINRAISFLVGNYSAEKVLEDVAKIQEQEEKLKLLRLWLANAKGNEEKIEQVIDVALNELIASISVTSITIEVLTELSSQLPYVRDNEARKRLYDRFKIIDKDLLTLGLAKNKYTYELNIFHTEYFINREKAISTISKIINEIESLDDLLIKIESFSEIFSKLSIINNPIFESKIDFVNDQIISLSELLYNKTASQFKISQQFLKSIGKVNPRLALKIINGMNNIARRERSRLLVLEAYLNNNLRYVNIDFLKEIEDAFEQKSSRETLCIEVLERYSEAKSLHFKVILLLLYFYEQLQQISNLNVRIRALIFAYKIVIKNQEWKSKLEKKIESQIYNAWKGLEADWQRIDMGFTLCYELSKHCPEFSRKLFEETESLKKESWIDSKLVAVTYINSVRLVIKAYYGLLASSTNLADDYRILEDLIARVPSEIEKLLLWTEVGFGAYQMENDEVLKKVTNEHIVLILHDLMERKTDIEEALDAFTLVHLSNEGLVMRYLSKIDLEIKEAALISICNYYITKRNPFELYDQNIVKYQATFSDLTKAVSILHMISTDNDIYYLLNHICKAISANEELAKAQISTLTSELSEIINTSFPDTKNITHEGFKIIAELQLSKISKPNDYNTYNLNLINRSEGLPNLSDSIFVKSILLEEISFTKMNNGQQCEKKLYEDITKSLNDLSVHYEFVQRVIDISESMYGYDKNAWKKFVSKAFSLSTTLKDGSDSYSSQRNLIDSMYRLDSSFAKELIKQVDKENQKGKINKMLHKHYETLEMADKIKNNKTLEQRERENSKGLVRSVLIALKSLNSERVGSKKLSEISNYLILGNKLPLREVYPVYAYYMNNCARTYKSVKDGSLASLHRDNFKESVTATNLIQILSQKKKVSEKSYRRFFIDEEFLTNKPIRPKTREIAFNFVKSWLKDEAEDFLIIADPYFKKEDLEIIKIIKETRGNVEIDILGPINGLHENVETSYKEYWKKISDEEPPFVNITFCGMQLGSSFKTPFHDRWIISKNGGLRLGTSISSLGLSKESEISVMKPNEALRIHQDTLYEYITRRKRELDGKRIHYKSFTL